MKDIYNYFENISNNLLCLYETSKQQKATRNLGDNRENIIHEFLSNILPPKLIIKSGEIWDSQNNRTGEIDRLVVRNDAPYLHFGSKNTYFFEGVFAAIEIKSKLNKKEFKKVIKSFQKIDSLKTNKRPFIFGGGRTLGRLFKILISFEGLSWRNINKTLGEEGSEKLFDMICILKRGILIGEELSAEIIRPNSVDGNIIFDQPKSAVAYLYYFLVGYSQSFVSSTFDIDGYFRPHPKYNKI